VAVTGADRARRPPRADHPGDVLAGRPVRLPTVGRPTLDALEAIRGAGRCDHIGVAAAQIDE